MRIIVRFFKWLFIVLISIFFILSAIPYFFSTHLKEAPQKPYDNSIFFSYHNTKFHFRLFVPKQIKRKGLLIHGFSASTFSFRNNIDSLLNNNTLVVAMDMPAFGYSDKSEDANYTDTTKIQAIHFLLEHINQLSPEKKWHLIGHSMGGVTISQFASAYPQQTQSLIYIDGLPFSQAHYALQILAVYPPLLKWADVILERKFLNMQSFQELLSSAYSQAADEESVNGYMTAFKTQYSGSAVFRMAAHSGYATIHDSTLNQLPKLIIWGKNDQWIPLENASKNLTKPNTQSLIINDAGHCPTETHPSEVNTAISNFISNLD